MLTQTLIEDDNIQVTFKEDNELWGLSFKNSSDNSEYLELIAEHATDEEYESIVEQIPIIEEVEEG